MSDPQKPGLRFLDSDAFHETMVPPMRKLTVHDEPPVKLDLRPAIESALVHYKIPKRLEQVEIPHVYLSGDRAWTHVLISYGLRNVFLAVVIDNTAKTVFGAYQLDLDEAYGNLQ